MPAPAPSPDFAFLSHGKLHRRNSADGQTRTVESAFGKSLRDRAAQIHDRHAWKMKGTGAQFTQGMMWRGGQARDPGEFRVAVTSVCAGSEPGALFYTLETDEVGGIFAVDPSGVENRLFHTADFRVRHISARPDRSEVAATVVYANACANIAVMKSDGTGFHEVTEGESVDLAPSWAPGPGRRLVFQSAGIGRDGHGRFTRLGPASIQSLDLESGELATLAEDAAADFLGPRMLADGSLLYIRRPYETGPAKASVGTLLKDTVLFPFRLIYAVFQYFNFFSMIYTGKPLSTSHGGAAQREPDLKQILLWGNLVDAGKAAQGADRSDSDAPSIVPATWQLVRRTSGGAETVAAKGVLSFDVTGDGGIVYSNGSAVYRMAAADGKAERVVKSELIEQVAAL